MAPRLIMESNLTRIINTPLHYSYPPPGDINYSIPFSAILIYRASVERALSNVAPDNIAQVPIPTNPKRVVNNLTLATHNNTTNLPRKRSAYG